MQLLTSSAILASFCIFISVITLRFATLSPVMPWVYAVCFGFGLSTLTVPLPYFVSETFGTLDYASIYSFCMLFSNLTGAVSQPIAGALCDITGSYDIVWTIGAGLVALAACSLVTATVTARRQNFNPNAKF